MNVSLAKLEPNPFRDIQHYKFNQEVLEELRESIKSTGFWDNILCRRTKNGKLELAYGHHRAEALRQLKGKNAEIGVIVKDLDDADMLRIMYRDNNEVYGRRAEVTVEAITKVVTGYAEGRWTLPPVPIKAAQNTVRSAPGYIPGCSPSSGEHPYTAETIAAFLGVAGRKGEVEKIRFALQALQGMAEKVITRGDIKGQTTQQAAETVRAARRVARTVGGKVGKRRARTVAKKVAAGFRSQKEGIKSARREAFREIAKSKVKDAPWIDDTARTVAAQITAIFGPKSDLKPSLTALIKEREHMTKVSSFRVKQALKDHIRQAIGFLNGLKGRK